MDVDTLRQRIPAEIPGLLRFARSLTRDPQQAEDLAQDTAARALARATAFREEASLTTWLHRILYHCAVDASRRRREVLTDLVADRAEELWRDDAYTVDAAEIVTRAETRAELEDALIRLPFGYRAAVVLHDAEGLTMAQIADLAEISLPAAKQRLRRGRMMLVTALAAGAERRAAIQGVPLACWDARRHVSDYLDGALDAQLARRLEQHLGRCPTCPPLYASLVGVRDALDRAGATLRDPDSVVPPTTLQRLMTQRPRDT